MGFDSLSAVGWLVGSRWSGLPPGKLPAETETDRPAAAHPALLLTLGSSVRGCPGLGYGVVAVAFSRNLPKPRVEPSSAALAGKLLTAEPAGQL